MLAAKTQQRMAPTPKARTLKPEVKAAESIRIVPKTGKASAADSDEALVRMAQEGNKTAFELLMRKHQSRIINTLKRIVGDADSQDIAQETFIKAYRALGSFRGDSAFTTWLHRVAINTAKNHLVARSRRTGAQEIDIADAELFGHSDKMSDHSTPEGEVLSSEIHFKIRRVIAKLHPELRDAITLREIQGLSYDEIAQVMGCPVGTVRSRIFRAREAVDLAIAPLVVS